MHNSYGSSNTTRSNLSYKNALKMLLDLGPFADKVIKTFNELWLIFSFCIKEAVVFPLSVFQRVVAPWCNPLTLQPEQSGGVGSRPGRAHHLSAITRGCGLD